MKRSRELRPLSSEHHQALLVAFQVKKGLAGHGESAGAPKDLPGLVQHARRFEERVLRTHGKAEEELLGPHLPAAERRRLAGEHAEMTRLLAEAGTARPAEQRGNLAAFADLLERHVRWEERELFEWLEANVEAAALAAVGGELEKRLVLASGDPRGAAGRPVARR